jgi:hypothetical protein
MRVHPGPTRGRLHTGAGDPFPHFRVDSILKNGLDRQHSLPPAATTALPEHENVRGPDYYH